MEKVANITIEADDVTVGFVIGTFYYMYNFIHICLI